MGASSTTPSFWLVCAVQVIVADTFTNLSAQYLGAEALPSQRPFVLLLTGLLVLLMCFPRNLQALGRLRTAGSAAPTNETLRTCTCESIGSGTYIIVRWWGR
jgi:hypothetical protein